MSDPVFPTMASAVKPNPAHAPHRPKPVMPTEASAVARPGDPVKWAKRPVDHETLPEHPLVSLLKSPARVKWNAITAARRLSGDLLIQRPEEILEAFCDYAASLEMEPKWTTKRKRTEGQSGETEIDTTASERIAAHMPPTIGGLCGVLGVSTSTWAKWRNEREELREAIGMVEAAIKDAQVAMSATKLGDAPTLIRLSGLAEKQEVKTETKVELSGGEAMDKLRNRLAVAAGQVAPQETSDGDGD